MRGFSWWKWGSIDSKISESLHGDEMWTTRLWLFQVSQRNTRWCGHDIRFFMPRGEPETNPTSRLLSLKIRLSIAINWFFYKCVFGHCFSSPYWSSPITLTAHIHYTLLCLKAFGLNPLRKYGIRLCIFCYCSCGHFFS